MDDLAERLAEREEQSIRRRSLSSDGSRIKEKRAARTLMLAVNWNRPDVARQLLAELGPTAGRTEAATKALQRAIVLSNVEIMEMVLALPDMSVSQINLCQLYHLNDKCRADPACTQCTPTPCTFHARCTADLVHHVWVQVPSARLRPRHARAHVASPHRHLQPAHAAREKLQDLPQGVKT